MIMLGSAIFTVTTISLLRWSASWFDLWFCNWPSCVISLWQLTFWFLRRKPQRCIWMIMFSFLLSWLLEPLGIIAFTTRSLSLFYREFWGGFGFPCWFLLSSTFLMSLAGIPIYRCIEFFKFSCCILTICEWGVCL